MSEKREGGLGGRKGLEIRQRKVIREKGVSREIGRAKKGNAKSRTRGGKAQNVISGRKKGFPRQLKPAKKGGGLGKGKKKRRVDFSVKRLQKGGKTKTTALLQKRWERGRTAAELITS